MSVMCVPVTQRHGPDRLAQYNTEYGAPGGGDELTGHQSHDMFIYLTVRCGSGRAGLVILSASPPVSMLKFP